MSIQQSLNKASTTSFKQKATLIDAIGDTVIHNAASHRYSKLLEWLYKKHELAFKLTNAAYETTMLQVTRVGHFGAVELLLDKDTDLTQSSHRGELPKRWLFTITLSRLKEIAHRFPKVPLVNRLQN